MKNLFTFCRQERPNQFLKAEDFVIGSGSKAATERLFNDLSHLKKTDTKQLGFEASPIEDNLYKWEVKLFGFDEDGDLAKDLKVCGEKYGLDFIKLQMTFPNNYPFAPPFVRVILPRFQFRKGHVTTGGSICMELLTQSGWTPANDIESVLIQIRAGMIAGEARLDLYSNQPYTEEEALSAFKRVAESHGWIPSTKDSKSTKKSLKE